MTISVKIVGLEEMQKRFAKAPDLVSKHGKVAMQKSVIMVEGYAKVNAPVGVNSRLRNSMVSKVETFGGSITGRVGSSMSEIYPLVMEYGRRPGAKMPPPQALERWVYLVMGVPADEALGVAFVVARNIGRRGIKGKFFLKRAYETSKSSILGFFQAALHSIVRDL